MTDEEMRPQLKRLCKKLDRMDCEYTIDAIQDLQQVLYDLIGFVEMNTPKEKSDDQ